MQNLEVLDFFSIMPENSTKLFDHGQNIVKTHFDG